MPKVSEAHLASRRAEIIEGARRAFATYGYEGATVARLEGRLRHDPEFVRKLAGTADDSDRLKAWLADAQARGEFRQDVDVVHIGRFASSLLNGIALRVAGG